MKNPIQPFRPISFFRRPEAAIGLILLVLFLIGLLIVTHYGASWDEPFRYDYAQKSLAAYGGGHSNLRDEKGPFFGMLALLGSNLFAGVIPGWKIIDGWHFMTFLSFLLGIYFFYRLCRRMIERWPALIATLLFGSQPVIWGHAFINPKDVPFLSFFLASVVLGFEMVDHFHPRDQGIHSTNPSFQRGAGTWQAAPQKLRRRLASLGMLWIGLPLLFPLVQSLVAEMVRQIYTASPSGWLGKLFAQVAPHATGIAVQAYIRKAQTQSSWIAMLIWVGLGVALALVVRRVFSPAAGWQTGFHWPDHSELKAWMQKVQNRPGTLTQGLIRADWPAILARGWNTLVAAARMFLKALACPQVLIAACFLGFANDIRTLGLSAGLMTAVYFFYRAGGKAIPRLLAYFSVGALAAYAFWPYLWGAPVNHYLESLLRAQDFNWPGVVTFAGQLIPGKDPPLSYLPVLFSLQFTETALALIAAGLAAAGFYFWKNAALRIEILILIAWFVLPVGAAIWLHSTLYDNFRQFLFATPPLFVLAGFSLQAGWSLIQQIGQKWAFAGVALAVLLPGVYADLHLHPYEYIYYNGLTGGVSGSFRFYDTDYWATSYREDLEYLNEVAPMNAAIQIYGADKSAKPYARPDLKIIACPTPEDFRSQIEYVIVLTSGNQDQLFYPKSRVIYQASRDEAVLSVVKEIQAGDDPSGCDAN